MELTIDEVKELVRHATYSTSCYQLKTYPNDTCYHRCLKVMFDGDGTYHNSYLLMSIEENGMKTKEARLSLVFLFEHLDMLSKVLSNLAERG